MSPLVWDFAHIGYFEELWLLREPRRAPRRSGRARRRLRRVRPRAERAGRATDPAAGRGRAYVADVRRRVLDAARRARAGRRRSAARTAASSFGLVAPARAAARRDDDCRRSQLGGTARADRPGGRPDHRGRRGARRGRAVRARRGRRCRGPTTTSCPPTRSTLPAFRIDRALVSNADYSAFIADGGYDDRALWTEDGWAWRESEAAAAPLFWQRDGERWWPAALRHARAGAADRTGAARLLVGSRRLRALGGQAAADGAGMGKGGPRPRR